MSILSNFFQPTQDKKITLTNDGKLQLYFVGVGSAFANTMFQSNMIIVKGKNHVMVDIGSKASIALHQAGVSVLDIENLLITHSHADHMGGVEEICLKGRYQAPFIKGCKIGECKPNLLTTEEYVKILWDCSLSGGLEHSEEISANKRLSMADYVNIIKGEQIDGYDRPVYQITVGKGDDAINLKMMRTNHIPDSSSSWHTAFYSFGVLVDDTFFISGDTRFDKDLLETFGPDAKLVFHDCQDFTGGVHASYDELSNLPSDLKSKMVLYHLPDSIYSKFNPEKEGFAGWAKAYFEGSYIF